MSEVSLRSIGDMGLVLLEGVNREIKQRRSIMDRAAKILQNRAKSNIGTYQEDGTDPFAPWAELADSTKEDRIRQGYPENEPELRNGELRDSIERVAEPLEAQVGSDSDVMVWQELGTEKMPPRSILGIAAVQSEKEIADLIGGAIVNELFGEGVLGGKFRF